MGQRVVRVNELLKREISRVLHSRYQSEAVAITILEVETAANLRQAKVFYSTVGDEQTRMRAESLLRRRRVEIQQAVGSVIVLKYLPQLEFIYDPSVERGARLNALLDELDIQDPLPEEGFPGSPPKD